MPYQEFVLRIAVLLTGVLMIVLGYRLKQSDKSLEVTPVLLIMVGALMVAGSAPW